MSGVYVVGVGAHPWGKWPDKPQLQLALEATSAALADAEIGWGDVQALVAASSRFEGGMGWGLHANEVAQAVAEHGMACVNVGGACAAGAIANAREQGDDPFGLRPMLYVGAGSVMFAGITGALLTFVLHDRPTSPMTPTPAPDGPAPQAEPW